MIPPRELRIQEEVTKYLESKELYPYSVICSFSIPPGDGILSITFFTSLDLEDFLNVLDYKNQCDKSGYLIFKDTNTTILKGLALFNLYYLI